MRRAKARSGPHRLRPLGTPISARVRTDGRGRPTLIFLGRRSHRVASVRSMWRIDDEWWRRSVSRWYFDLVLEDGRLLTVYRDLTENGWFVQAGG